VLKEESMPANTATLDIERGKLDALRLLPWQTDTSISIRAWGYVEHDEYRSAKSLIHQLIDTIAKNGNLLLNVGPKADGTIPDEARTILLQMGGRLTTNREAIYNSRPFSVFGEGPTKAPSNPTQMNSDVQTYTPADIRYTTSRDGSVSVRVRARCSHRAQSDATNTVPPQPLSAWGHLFRYNRRFHCKSFLLPSD